MNKEQAAPYELALRRMRTDLVARIALHRGGDRSRAEATADHFGHPEDSPAQIATEKDLELAIGDHEMVELNAINAALNRIDLGTYGECTDCGVEIPPARLGAAPETPRCISCQEAVEKRLAA